MSGIPYKAPVQPHGPDRECRKRCERLARALGPHSQDSIGEFVHEHLGGIYEAARLRARTLSGLERKLRIACEKRVERLQKALAATATPKGG